jgi:hypothetical protein
MRPVGDVRTAIARAAGELVAPDRGPTLREMAEKACVGQASALYTIKNMCRSGELVKVRERKVDYRTRPVAEYAPAAQPNFDKPSSGLVNLGNCMMDWSR